MARLESEIGDLVRRYAALTGNTLTIGTAESATGGRVADRITGVSGSSDYFAGSVVSYSNDVKARLLGVREETLAIHGAVSAETAVEMASGGRRLLRVDICVSDTGIAGPGGATGGKPVGLFYLGLVAEGVAVSEKYVFSGDRQSNKRQAAQAVLRMLRRHLLEILARQEKAAGEPAGPTRNAGRRVF